MIGNLNLFCATATTSTSFSDVNVSNNVIYSRNQLSGSNWVKVDNSQLTLFYLGFFANFLINFWSFSIYFAKNRKSNFMIFGITLAALLVNMGSMFISILFGPYTFGNFALSVFLNYLIRTFLFAICLLFFAKNSAQVGDLLEFSTVLSQRFVDEKRVSRNIPYTYMFTNILLILFSCVLPLLLVRYMNIDRILR